MVIKLDEILKYLEHANTKLTEVSGDLEKQDADHLTEKLQLIIDEIKGDFQYP
jgi:hypothetical protein